MSVHQSAHGRTFFKMSWEMIYWYMIFFLSHALSCFARQIPGTHITHNATRSRRCGWGICSPWPMQGGGGLVELTAPHRPTPSTRYLKDISLSEEGFFFHREPFNSSFNMLPPFIFTTTGWEKPDSTRLKCSTDSKVTGRAALSLCDRRRTSVVAAEQSHSEQWGKAARGLCPPRSTTEQWLKQI